MTIIAKSQTEMDVNVGEREIHAALTRKMSQHANHIDRIVIMALVYSEKFDK